MSTAQAKRGEILYRGGSEYAVEKDKKVLESQFDRKEQKVFLLTMIGMVIVMTGCNNQLTEVADIDITASDTRTYHSSKTEYVNTEKIAEIYQNIYDDATQTNVLNCLEIKQRIVAKLGENGYVAVDSENR